MNLSNLQPAKNSVRKRKIIARGQGSGRGRTATRGSKGDKSRSGYSQKFGFEGGQMPLYKRIPKFGFKNPNRKSYKAINLDTLQKLIEKTNSEIITLELLRENGLIGKNDYVKILSRGQIINKVTVASHAFSKKAQEKIEAVGGSVIKL